jgi:hypothetical protein
MNRLPVLIAFAWCAAFGVVLLFIPARLRAACKSYIGWNPYDLPIWLLRLFGIIMLVVASLILWDGIAS